MLRTVTRSVLLVAIFSSLVIPACSAPSSMHGEDLAGLLAALSSDDVAERDRAVASLARCDAAAVTPLVDLLAGEDRTAAAGARAAIELLTHNAAAPAPGEAGSQPRSKGDRSRVTQALLVEVENDSRPPDVRRWLLRLVGFTALDGAVAKIASRLDDRDLGDMALHALAQIPGDKAHEALRDALEDGPLEIRASLILALGSRRDPADAGTIQPFVLDDDRSLRLAAIGALGMIPAASSGSILWDAAGRKTDGEAAAARAACLALAHSLLDAGEREEATVLFERFHVEADEPHFRCAGLLGLVKAHPEKAVPLLLGAISGDQEKIAGAAVQELARLPGEDITLAMAEAVADAGNRSRARLIHALGRRCDGAAAAAIARVVAFSKTAPDEAKTAVLNALAAREDPALEGYFREETRSECEEVVIAAVDALGRLGNPAVAPLLFEIAAAGCDGENAAALKGCILIGDAIAEQDSAGALALYRRVLALAHAEPEQERVVERLGKLGDPAALADIVPFLDGRGDSLVKMAARAVAPLAIRLADETDGAGKEEERRRAIGLLEKVVALSDHAGSVRDAVMKLRACGIDADLPVPAGFVKHFRVVGPFRGRERMLATDLFPTEKPVDCKEPVRDGDSTYRWKYFPPEDVRGMLDLLRAVAPANDVGAYACTEVTVAGACDALFTIGSDDDVFCWLNEKKVHSFEGGRGWGPDQDRVKVRLEKGANRILFKVLNGGGGWALSLKITDSDGNPLEFVEQKP
jgi:HEAT repeat protein